MWSFIPLRQSLEQGLGIGVAEKFCKSFNFELQAAANEDSIVISLGSVHSFPLMKSIAICRRQRFEIP